MMADKNGSHKTPPLRKTKIFFDVNKGEFWIELNGRFVALKKSELKLELRSQGLRVEGPPWFDGLSEVEWQFWDSINSRMVDYAGPMAGSRAGVFHDPAGRAFLVTDEPRGVWADLPKKSPAPKWFIEFVTSLLPDDQDWHFFNWLKIAFETLRAGDYRPGPVLVFAGPAKCGKSLLQSLITQVLGGREASPFEYMMGGSKFASELAGAEHWKIEEPDASTQIRKRRSFGIKLKEAAFNREFRIEGKGKDALTLSLFRRITISVNDEPENLAVVPPMDGSLEDKIGLLKCSPVLVGADRVEIWKTVLAEIPLIRAWLVRNFPGSKIPEAYRDERTLLRPFQHPELLAELCNLAPETRLLQLIDLVEFSEMENPAPITTKSIDLENKLRGGKYAFEVEKILTFGGACGTFLTRLERTRPDRITKKKIAGHHHFTITAPKEQKEEGQ